MSSFPKHEENILELKKLGFDVEEYLDDNGNVTMDSWGYDSLVYLVSGIICQLGADDYKVGSSK